MSRVGEKIKSARIKSGLSQKQLAKKLGVAESFINEVELGRKVLNENIIQRISKVLGQDINDISMSFEEEIFKEEAKEVKLKENKSLEKGENIKEIWNDAFGAVLKTVPVYAYDLKRVLGTKQLPITSNKVEGYSQDKVLFIKIEDDNMLSYRIAKGDIAFGHLTAFIESNGIYLVEYGDTRAIREVKKLDSNKILLISGSGALRTETINTKDLKAFAKLERVEIKL